MGTAPSTATKQHRALLRTVACMCRRYVRWAAASHTRCADTTRASKVGHRRWRLQRRHPCSRQQAVQHNSQASQSIDLQGMECVGWRSALVIQQVCVCVSFFLAQRAHQHSSSAVASAQPARAHHSTVSTRCCAATTHPAWCCCSRQLLAHLTGKVVAVEL